MQKLSRSGTYRLDKETFRVDILPRFDDSMDEKLTIAPNCAIHYAVCAVSMLGICVLLGSLVWSIFYPSNIVLLVELGKMVITISLICLLYANLYRVHQIYVLVNAVWVIVAVLSLTLAVGFSLNRFFIFYKRPVCLLPLMEKCEPLHSIMFCLLVGCVSASLAFMTHLDMKYIMVIDSENRYRDTDQPTYVSAVGAGFGASDSIASIKQSPICAFERNRF